MDESELALAIDDARREAQDALESVSRQFEDHVERIRERRDARIRELVIAAGKLICPDCRGHGEVQRLDAGYMRRFGLREWDGCNRCGGYLDRRGCGFVEG